MVQTYKPKQQQQNKQHAFLILKSFFVIPVSDGLEMATESGGKTRGVVKAPVGDPPAIKSSGNSSDFDKTLCDFASKNMQRKLPANKAGPAGTANGEKVKSFSNVVKTGNPGAKPSASTKTKEQMIVDVYAHNLRPEEKTRSKPTAIARNMIINCLGLRDDEFANVYARRKSREPFQFVVIIELQSKIDLQKYKGINYFRFGTGGTDNWVGSVRGVKEEDHGNSVIVRINELLPSELVGNYGLIKAALTRKGYNLKSGLIRGKYQKPKEYDEKMEEDYGKWRLEGRHDGRHHFYCVRMSSYPSYVIVRNHRINLEVDRRELKRAAGEASGEGVDDPDDEDDDAEGVDEANEGGDNPADNEEMPEAEEIAQENDLDEDYQKGIEDVDLHDTALSGLMMEEVFNIPKHIAENMNDFSNNDSIQEYICRRFTKNIEFDVNDKRKKNDNILEFSNDQRAKANEAWSSVAYFVEIFRKGEMPNKQFQHAIFGVLRETMKDIKDIRKQEDPTNTEQVVILPKENPLESDDEEPETEENKDRLTPNKIAKKIYSDPEFIKVRSTYDNMENVDSRLNFLQGLPLADGQELKTFVKLQGASESEKILQAINDHFHRNTMKLERLQRQYMAKRRREDRDSPPQKPRRLKKAKANLKTPDEAEDEFLFDVDLGITNEVQMQAISHYKKNKTSLTTKGDNEDSWDDLTSKYWIAQAMIQLTEGVYATSFENHIEYGTHERMVKRFLTKSNLLISNDRSKPELTAEEINLALRITGMKTRLSRRARRNTHFAKEKSKLRQFLSDNSKTATFDKLINLAREVDRDVQQWHQKKHLEARISSDKAMLEKNQHELDSQLKDITNDSEAEEVKDRFKENMSVYEKSISAATAELETIDSDLHIESEDPTPEVDEEMA